MLEIINYINVQNEEITFYYDEKRDRSILWNLDKKEVKEIVESPHYEAKTKILDIVASDFKELIYVCDFLIDEEDVDYIEGKCKNEFIESYEKYFKEVE